MDHCRSEQSWNLWYSLSELLRKECKLKSASVTMVIIEAKIRDLIDYLTNIQSFYRIANIWKEEEEWLTHTKMTCMCIIE